nr:TDT family transporter [Tissierella sp.]
MNGLIKRVPLAMAGLMLALAAIGNLVLSYGLIYRNIAGIISAILLVLLLMKIIMYPNIAKEELKNPVVASVFPTLTMGMMLLSTYIKPIAPGLAFGIWVISVAGHLALIIKFTINYVIKLDIKTVFPSWFIVFVGIVVASVTAPAFEMQGVGKIIFWFGLISYFLLLPIVVKRYRLGNIPEAAMPTISIFTAPLSLCLAGYMNSFESKNMFIVWGLVVLSQLSYIFVLSQLAKLLKSKFYPSFSGFTFPLVISAISIKLTNGFLVTSGQAISSLKYIVIFEEIMAVLMVAFVLLKYIQFLIVPIEIKETLSVVNK